MTFAALALLISWETGWFALALLWPRTHNDASEFVMRAAISGGLGLAISSVLYLMCLAVGVSDRPWVVGLDVAALVACASIARRMPVAKIGGAVAPSEATTTFDWVLRGSVLVALLINANAWFARFRDEPLGFWDAFAIWNLKARFFFLDGGEGWQRAFSNAISWSHTDYPLLLPLNVARLWTYAGSAEQVVPALFSVFFVLLALALLFGVVASLANAALGYVVVLALLATPALMGQGVWQVADIPLAFFLASATGLVLASGRDGTTDRAALIVAGVCAGAGAWTKNEGLLFAFAIPAAIALAGPRAEVGKRLPRALDFAKGLALPVLLLLVVKVSLAGENDLAADFSLASLARIFDLGRHAEILVSFARTLVMLAGIPLLALIVALGVWRRFRRATEASRGIAAVAFALLLQLSGYYFIYLTTERDLAWHLGTSNLRLFVQLWPSALLLFFVGVRPFEEPESTS